MAARNLNEVFSFVHKFMNLRKNGDNAALSLQCQDGRVTINLQLHLPPCPPTQYQPHQPPYPNPRSRPTPSRSRRTIRRASARAQAEKADNDSLISPARSASEQVVISTAVQANANNSHNEAEEAFKAPTKLSHNSSHQVPAPAEQADPAVGQHDQLHCRLEDQEQELPQCTQPPPPLDHNSQCNEDFKTEVDSEPKHNFTVEEFSEMKQIMEEFKNNFTNGLAESVRESVRDAFKPP